MKRKEIKKVRHSRRFLPGISLLYVVSQIGKILHLIKDKKAGDPRLQHSGMTAFLGFTLIELLVVVLIIGILAAIALPQYEKAVWKSKAAQLQVLVKSLADAQAAYFLANGSYAADFSSLDIGFDSLPSHPSSATNNLTVASGDAVRANTEMELVINGTTTGWLFSLALFKAGPYSGAGFSFLQVTDGTLTEKKWYCQEYENIPQGKFCTKVIGLTNTPITTLNYRYYSFN